MVTESARASAAHADELLAHIGRLRADADLMDGYARRLRATVTTLDGCPTAPEWGRPALERQAAACASAAVRLRTAAEALLAHARVDRPTRGAMSGPSS
ncbi:hypothetical protein HEP81_00583 [Streptomyces griseofuscus]|uniref:Uncharacterized protein n=1 Tax=Streptomyces griseofuscus TaxID=146922 RepID=A0A7H1PS89_9ACTN|nr:hypothetical protein [Streptomyces griseofuscus]QNT90919.1 hypothetical protein HEP81_00583 [Streptomyces griseofuscus]